MITADDRLAIIDAVHRWSHVADGPAAEGLDEVMTADATFTIAGGLSLSGRDAITDHLAREAAARPVQTRRHVRNPVFEIVTADRVVTRSYYLLTGVAGTGFAKPLATGVYEDELVPTSDGWRIRSRTAHPDGSGTGIRA